MTTTRMAAVLVVVAVAGLAVAPALGGAAAVPTQDGDEGDVSASNESESNATVSAVMQANAAEAEHAVESGMFDAAFETADNESRAALVADHTDDLEADLEALREERETLRERADELSPSVYQARMTRLAVEISSLERAIDRTEPKANATGVGRERLETLRENATELAGPDVAAAARGVPGFGEHPGAGPGPAAGPGANGPQADERTAGDGTPPGQGDSPAGNETPPGHERDASPSAVDGGGPNESAQGHGQGNGPPSDDEDGDRGPPDRGNGSGDESSTDDSGGSGGSDGADGSGGGPPAETPGQ